MSWLRLDIRFAMRSLVRRPSFTIIAVITLALGIGATTAIFSVVNGVLLRPLSYADSERIVAVWQRSTTEVRRVELGQLSVPNFVDVRTASTSFSALALFRNANITLVDESSAELIPGGEVTPEFFRVFGADPVLGRTFTDQETQYRGPTVAIVSHGFWQERLSGDVNVLGQTLQLQGATYTIVGVAPPDFSFPNQARIWLPVQNNDEDCGRGCTLFTGIGLIQPGVDVQRAAAELGALAARLEQEYPRSNTNTTVDVAPLHEVIVGDVRQALFVVFGAVFMLLLIACANVANLMLVRGVTRQTEIAVRSVLGAGRRRLLAQLVTESGLLALLGTIAGFLLAMWGIELLRHMAPRDLPRAAEIALDLRVLGFAVLLAVVTVSLFGLAPALQLSRAPFSHALREGGRGSTGGRHRARGLILATEVAMSVMLLLGAGLLLRSLAEMRSVDPGFDADDVTHFSVSLPSARYSDPAQRVRFTENVLERLSAVPGVDGTGFIVGLPFGTVSIGGSFKRMDQPPPKPADEPSAAYHAIAPGYLETLRIPVAQGRGFLPSDRAGSMPVVLVNRSLVLRYFPGEDAIGKMIDLQVSVGYPDTLPRTIVGVVEDVRSYSLRRVPEPAVYTPEAQAGAGFGAFVIRSSGPADQVLRTARAVVESVDPEIPLMRPGTMHELLTADTARHTFYLMLLGLFALLAVTLAAVGIYGVVAFVVSHRTREIGVRMALGAHAREVISLVVWQGLRPALLGAAIGVGGALAGGRVISSMLYGVQPHDPLALVGVAAVVAGIVALACTAPARRATRISPAAALRAE
jgi:putative ABC transport system permease protein